MNILHIDSSIQGDLSVSRRLSSAMVERLTRQSPRATVVYRDLAANPVPQFSPAVVQTMPSGEGVGSDDLKVLATILDEVMAADVIVIGAPMYNFSVPSQLKSWLDALVVPGRTFRYENGTVTGMLGDKRVLIASSRGGIYAPGTPHAMADHQEPLLLGLLGFIGITDVRVVRAEGVRLGPEHAKEAISAALKEVAALALPFAA